MLRESGPMSRRAAQSPLLPLAALLATVAGVLVQGAAAGTATPAPPPARATVKAPSVAKPDLDKTALAYISDYWHQLGTRTRHGVVLVGEPRTPGILVAPGLAVAAAGPASDPAPVPGDESVRGAGGERLTATAPELGLALYALDPIAGGEPLQPTDPASLEAGSRVAAVGLTADGRLAVVPGTLAAALPEGGPPRGTEALDVSLALPPAVRTAAVVDLDGKVLGAAFAGQDGLRVMSWRGVLAVVDRMRRSRSVRAIEVSDVPPDTLRLRGVGRGVLVAGVRETAFHGRTELRPGDVLLRWDGHDVSAAADFVTLYDGTTAGTLVDVSLVRGARHLLVSFPMPRSDGLPAVAHVRLEKLGVSFVSRGDGGDPGTPPPAAWRVEDVSPGSPASEAGLAAGDGILAIGGGEQDPAKVGRLLRDLGSRRQPVVLTVLRKEHAVLVTLDPRRGAAHG